MRWNVGLNFNFPPGGENRSVHPYMCTCVRARRSLNRKRGPPVLFDAFIASQDGKFTYWYLRPNQLDSGIVPLFAVPNFPSYPSNHSTFSAARSEILAYLFPEHADFIRSVGKEAGDSRIWAGIHYPMDNVAGVNLGKSVSQVFISWAQSDGSQ